MKKENRRRGSKVFTTDPDKFPKAHITDVRGTATGSSQHLRPVKASMDRYGRDQKQIQNALVDIQGNPLQSSEAQQNNGIFQYVPEGIAPSALGGYNDRRTANSGLGGDVFGVGTTGINTPAADRVGPAREFYSFRMTQTYWQIPMQNQTKELNFLRRAMYLRDEIMGAALDMMAEFPYGEANLVTDDNKVRKIFEDCINEVGLLDFMPRITLHYLLHGEAIPWHWWDATKGYWTSLFSLDPNDVEVASFPYSHAGEVMQIVPSAYIRHVATAGDEIFKMIQRNIPVQLLNALRSNQKVLLKDENATYIMRENFPLMDASGFIIRGQSIIDRLFRVWIYYEKLMEADMAIADNYIFPMNFVRIGDETFQPTQEDLNHFATMIEEARFDIKPFIIYHNAFELDSIQLGSQILDSTPRLERLDELKYMALGVNKDLLSGNSTFQSARTGLQIFLTRESTLRGKMEHSWMYPKFLDPIAREHEIYSPLKRSQLDHGIRVKNYKKVYFRDELNPRNAKRYSDKVEDRELGTPKIDWHTRLHAVQDSDYIAQLKDLYEAERDKTKGIISSSTYLDAIGLDYNREMERKKKDEDLSEKLFAEEPAAGGENKEEEGAENESDRNYKTITSGSWIDRLSQVARNIGLNKKQDINSDINAINSFFAKENEILYKAGIRNYEKPWESIHLYSGKSTNKTKKGNMLASMILPNSSELDFVFNAKDISMLDKIQKNKNLSLRFKSDFEDNYNTIVSIIQNMHDSILGKEKVSDELSGSTFIAKFEEKCPNYIELAYDYGKKSAYKEYNNEKLIKKRAELGFKSYANEVFSSITNFNDTEFVEMSKSGLYDKLRVGDQKNSVLGMVHAAIMNIYNIGYLHGLKEQDKKVFKWIADKDSCILCRARHNRVYDIEEFLNQYDNNWHKASHQYCTCIPQEYIVKENNSEVGFKKLEVLHNELRNSQVRFSNYRVCNDVSQDSVFVKINGNKKFDEKIEACVIDKEFLISAWVKDPVGLYIGALSDLLWKKIDSKNLIEESILQFPSFKKDQLSMLQRSGIFDFDGKNYRFSGKFIESKQTEDHESKMLDDLLQARNYAVSWNLKGDPLYDNTNIYNAQDVGKEDLFKLMVKAYFFKNDELHRNNDTVWNQLFDKIGSVVKFENL